MTRCLIAGGGPAGMMLGLLLARSGVDVLVLEKHADFLRDFRGDTLHPSTLQVMQELGLLDELLQLPHQKLRTLTGEIGEVTTEIADFSHLPVAARYIALMPQWDFLNFLLRSAGRYPSFEHRMRTEALDLVTDGGRIRGLEVQAPEGRQQIRADLVVDATGRGTRLTEKAGLPRIDLGAPIDVLWFRLPREPDDGEQTAGRFERGQLLVRIFRGDYWQCAYVIPKGGAEKVRSRGIEAFRREVAALSPGLAPQLERIASFDEVKLLSVSVDRLTRWHRDGFLAIGDAAHAMSPVGGVGINLAIQDAVATANILADGLRSGPVPESLLARVQARRMLPTRLTQAGQVFAHNRILVPTLSAAKPFGRPLVARAFKRFPFLRRIPARLIGMGVRPEHVRAAPAAATR